MNKIIFSALIALLFAASSQAQDIKTYPVSGSTVDELIRSMKANSPQGYWAYTRNFWKYEYKYLYSNGVFDLSNVTISRTVEITMPRWSAYASASNCLKRSWDAMYNSLKNHEDKHVSIANPVSEKLMRAIEAVGTKASANELERAIDNAANAVFAENRKLQAMFDASTNHGRTDPVNPVVLKSCS